MAEPDGIEQDETPTNPELEAFDKAPPDADREFFKREAEKAFQARDRAKEEAAKARGMTDAEREELQRLKALEEEREHRELQKRGEFDKSLEKIAAKHAEELAAEREKAQGAAERLHKTLIGLAFAQSPDLFGDTGKTVLTPEIAEAYFGRYVDLDPDTNQVIVRDADGDVITDVKTGRPAAFSVALGELIDGMPSKDRILRGSGKTGSGSSGGTETGARSTASRAELAQRAIAGDKSAIAELERTSSRKPSRSIWDQKVG